MAYSAIHLLFELVPERSRPYVSWSCAAADSAVFPSPVCWNDGVMLRIDIAPLKAGVHTFVLEPEAEDIDLSPDRFRAVRVEVRLDVHERRILASLRASATATLECDRTLVDFDQPIEGLYHVLFASAEIVGEASEGYEEVRVLEPSDQEIDLTNVVRDTLLLSIPTRKIAPGAEDLPIPTVFGAPSGEDAGDPRWETLRRLRSPDDAS